MLFRMVPKHKTHKNNQNVCFRAMLFRMVPKQKSNVFFLTLGFRAMLFRMVPKLIGGLFPGVIVLELCCFEWFQNN